MTTKTSASGGGAKKPPGKMLLRPKVPRGPKTERTRKGARPPADAATNEARRVAVAVADAALDKKALSVEIIDVRGKVNYADYIVVMSGRSDRQVAAIARAIEETVTTKERVRCLSVEGLPHSAWVLLDFGDVIVHVFHEDTRGYYDVESLWIDAARLRLEPPDSTSI